MTAKLVFHSDSELLEGPVFDYKNRLLYFVSILDGLVYCFNPVSKAILGIKMDSPVGCVFVTGKKQVVAASKDGFFEIDFNTLQKRYVFQIDMDSALRYNDGIQDARGRFIVGTMGYPQINENAGKLYSYFQGQYKTIVENTTISNGLAFSADNTILYFIDTPTKKVAKFSYNLEDGAVEFIDFVIEFKGESSPDGMCIDKDGMLWIAEWGGACVSRWDPLTGKQLDKRNLPCLNVSSCCLDFYNNLYVTTAKSESKKDILGGGLFYVELNQS